MEYQCELHKDRECAGLVAVCPVNGILMKFQQSTNIPKTAPGVRLVWVHIWGYQAQCAWSGYIYGDTKRSAPGLVSNIFTHNDIYMY